MAELPSDALQLVVTAIHGLQSGGGSRDEHFSPHRMNLGYLPHLCAI